MIDKVVEIGILFDFYGKLLTEKQYKAIELYYMQDLSLAEIGERLNVSRQGVFDVLRRAENNLYEYENKLKLVNKFDKNIDDIRRIIEYSYSISKLLKEDNIEEINNKLDQIIKLGKDLVDR